jgi:hypothetical protein
VVLEIDGRAVERQTVAIEPDASAAVSFAPITLAESNVQGVIRAGTDGLPQDNNFFFVLSPTRPISALLIQNDASAGLFVKTALDRGRSPAFRTDMVAAANVSAESLSGRSLVIVNDATLSSPAAQLLAGFAERGGGVLVVLGERTPAAAGWPLMPGTLGAAVDRLALSGGTLGFLDYSHPAFDEFRDPRSGSFSNMRFMRYRSLRPAPEDRVLARFDDGAPAIVERRVGGGRVIAMTSTLDGSWNDAPRHAMYLPLVHELSAYLAQYEVSDAWQTVGRMFDISSPVGALVRDGQVAPGAATGAVRGVVVSPSGEQTTLGTGAAESVALAEQGFYSVRLSGSGDRRPYAVAVNIAPEESDLTSLPPDDLLAATGQAAASAAATSELEPLTPSEIEKRQSLWWFLLVGGLIALLAESSLSNRLSARARGQASQSRPAAG